LRNHGFAACAESVEEALHLAYNTIIGCETQVKALSAGRENLVMPSKQAIESVHNIAKYGANGMNRITETTNGDKMTHTFDGTGKFKWGIGELEWEAHMRVLDEAGYETGHRYRMPTMRNIIYAKKKTMMKF